MYFINGTQLSDLYDKAQSYISHLDSLKERIDTAIAANPHLDNDLDEIGGWVDDTLDAMNALIERLGYSGDNLRDYVGHCKDELDEYEKNAINIIETAENYDQIIELHCESIGEATDVDRVTISKQELANLIQKTL